jgi:hypothetical protein
MTQPFNGLGLNLGNLSRLSNAETRSCSAENPTGAKGQGGRHVDPNHGPSRDLGAGWKVRPCTGIKPGETLVPADAAYLHAQFRRTNPLPYKHIHTLLDGVRGQGHYVGAYMAWQVNNNGWWGEGEIKFYLDGVLVSDRTARGVPQTAAHFSSVGVRLRDGERNHRPCR